MASLSQLRQPIKEELDEFELRFKAAMKSTVPLLDKITYYIVKRKGKQVRPMFVFLTAKLLAPINDKTYVAASLVELLHTATLVHDDVVDDSHIRRGFFSINALWKNKIAVLAGDFLLSKGLLIAIENKHYDLLEIMSHAVRKVSEGELLQFEKARKLDINEEVYFEIIKSKTASLISAACGIGAASTSDDQSQIAKAQEFGEAAGMAFQIKDDLFDYGYENIGKPTGIDIKEKKMTLPLIYTLNNVDKSTNNKIRSIIKRKSEQKKYQQEVIRIVKENGGIEYAEAVMRDYKKKALDILETFPDSEARQSLGSLLDFVIDRKN
ncbi:MAG: octaprenyl-diphosphate synthase [Saprospiraceae bacterium]|jgi:octaprenyl-diphosphate synthase